MGSWRRMEIRDRLIARGGWNPVHCHATAAAVECVVVGWDLNICSLFAASYYYHHLHWIVWYFG